MVGARNCSKLMAGTRGYYQIDLKIKETADVKIHAYAVAGALFSSDSEKRSSAMCSRRTEDRKGLVTEIKRKGPSSNESVDSGEGNFTTKGTGEGQL